MGEKSEAESKSEPPKNSLPSEKHGSTISNKKAGIPLAREKEKERSSRRVEKEVLLTLVRCARELGDGPR